MESSTRISVAIRLRPLLKDEKEQGMTNSKLSIDSFDQSIM